MCKCKVIYVNLSNNDNREGRRRQQQRQEMGILKENEEKSIIKGSIFVSDNTVRSVRHVFHGHFFVILFQRSQILKAQIGPGEKKRTEFVNCFFLLDFFCSNSKNCWYKY